MTADFSRVETRVGQTLCLQGNNIFIDYLETKSEFEILMNFDHLTAGGKRNNLNVGYQVIHWGGS